MGSNSSWGYKQKILNYADTDKVREYATPREAIKLTAGQKQRILVALKRDDVNPAALADQYHVSISTINRIKKEGSV